MMEGRCRSWSSESGTRSTASPQCSRTRSPGVLTPAARWALPRCCTASPSGVASGSGQVEAVGRCEQPIGCPACPATGGCAVRGQKSKNCRTRSFRSRSDHKTLTINNLCTVQARGHPIETHKNEKILDRCLAVWTMIGYPLPNLPANVYGKCVWSVDGNGG